jgi:hypothetical protein
MRELLKHIDFLPFGRFRTLLLISCFAMGISLSSSAQQEWVFTQYSFNLYDVNAAAVGDGQQNSIALRARKQWTGIKGAPESIHASFQKPFETRNSELISQRQLKALELIDCESMKIKN